MFRYEKVDNGVNAYINGEMTIYTAEPLWQELFQLLQEEHEPLQVDLAGVTDIDSSGLQILLVAKTLYRNSNKELLLINHSTPVVSAITLMDLASLLNDPIVMPREEQP